MALNGPGRDLRVGVYPGTFDPLTVAHLAVADAAVRAHRLDRLVLAVSVEPLGKREVSRTVLDARLDAIRGAAGSRAWLHVERVEVRLIAEIAQGYDVVVMGADKWEQVNDPRWYHDEAHRRDALGAMPTVAVAPRRGSTCPVNLRLDVDERYWDVSSSAVRGGRTEWAASESGVRER